MMADLQAEIERLKHKIMEKNQTEQTPLQDQIDCLRQLKSDQDSTTLTRKRRATVIASQLRHEHLVGMGITLNVEELS